MVHDLFIMLLAGALVNKALFKTFPKGKSGWVTALILGAFGYIPGAILGSSFGLRGNFISDVVLTFVGTCIVLVVVAKLRSRKPASEPAK